MLHRILIGIDERGLADPALLMAPQLADAFDATLELVHAVPHPSRWVHTSEPERDAAYAELMTRARAAVSAHLEWCLGSDEIAGTPIAQALTVVPGRAGEALAKRAREVDADLIVIGPHARHGWFELGGTAQDVLAASPCAVWVQPSTPAPVRRVLLAVQAGDENHAALELARGLASKFEAQLTAFHCYVPPELAYAADPRLGPTYVVDQERKHDREAFERSIHGFDWKGVEIATTFCEGRPANEILARQDAADLIVMGTHARGRLASFVLGSQARAVLRHARIPVVCAPTTARKALEPAAAGASSQRSA